MPKTAQEFADLALGSFEIEHSETLQGMTARGLECGEQARAALVVCRAEDAETRVGEQREQLV